MKDCSLAEARTFLWSHVDDPKGIECPCCDQRAKRYRRKINSSMAAWLINLVRLYKESGDFEHVNEIGRVARSEHDFAKCRYWGLIVQKTNEDTKKKCSGLWKPTEKGITFVEGRIWITRLAVVYNEELQYRKIDGEWEEWFEGEEINIHDALGDKFDYAALMGNEEAAV